MESSAESTSPANVLRYPPLRASSSILLIAHSVFLDILISGITHPIAAILTILGPLHALPSWFCSAYPLFTYAFYIVGTWANTMLALQRLTAIAAPHRFPLLQRRSAVVALYLLPWVISYFLNLFPALNLVGITMNRIPFSGTCLIMSVAGTVDRLMIYTVPAVFLPAVVKGICYAIVLTRSVGQLRDEEQRTNNPRRIAANRRRLDVSRALFMCYFWHCTALFPTVLFTNFLPGVYVNHVALQCILRWLTATNGAFNPVMSCN
ncbi:hypothetical protein RvY_13382 [Ramazzottius varieornatus]|uniref:G-protein coupled receptors family 1 profile domain-containing protein n=1 Tax=Ramazzottius varieornatus TaxID=947166 RepID=A0A1D1VMM9_RAMVA|nr:hypothetical protein RvY_13382 [Ramazzottius varieornatus]